MERFASAQWRGNLRQGIGFITAESGAFHDLPYSFQKRFGQQKGTNPEELIAAAYSACFAMSMSEELEKIKQKVEYLDVRATISLEESKGSWFIPKIILDIAAKVPGASQKQVRASAESAKLNCPVSKLLKAQVEMNLSIISSSDLQKPQL
jgi:osmotically inducible protein OsmC